MIKNNTSDRLTIRIWGIIIFFISMLLNMVVYSSMNREPVSKTENEILCETKNICVGEYYVFGVKETYNARINQRVISMHISTRSEIDPLDYYKPNTVLDLSVNDEDANKIMYRINQASIMGDSINLLVKYNGGKKYILYGIDENLKNVVVPESAKLKLDKSYE